jgi:GntR family transcriptional regulator, arabinose operon transcriptional repressor
MVTIRAKTEIGDNLGAVDGSEDRQPKYRKIVESLRANIAAGQYGNGARLPSEAELVRRFGVSRMTVVKAMQQLQQEGLLVRRTGSGTYLAESGVTQNLVFGLIIPELGDTEIFEPICKGMAQSPDIKGHSLSWGHSLTGSANREEVAEHLCQQYVEQKVSGVFFAPLEFSRRRDQINRRILKSLNGAGIPVVLLDRCELPYPERSDYDLVGLDNRRAGYVVAEHLIRQGAQHIAFLAREGSAETVDDRIAGYRDALFVHNLLSTSYLVVRGDGSDPVAIKEVLQKNQIDAFLCANDHTAAKLMHSLLTLDVRIPGDIRIAGVDDVKYAELLPVPLTTFRQPCADIGAAAVAAMKERISNPDLAGRSILLSGRLIVRRSCGERADVI